MCAVASKVIFCSSLIIIIYYYYYYCYYYYYYYYYYCLYFLFIIYVYIFWGARVNKILWCDHSNEICVPCNDCSAFYE